VTRSIFRTALNPNREKGQYLATRKELAADAVLMFLAGTDTTAHALAFGIWQMVKMPELWKRLQQEVDPVLKESQGFSPARQLETLPFLVSTQRTPSIRLV
jgi:cytochrome P450